MNSPSMTQARLPIVAPSVSPRALPGKCTCNDIIHADKGCSTCLREAKPFRLQRAATLGGSIGEVTPIVRDVIQSGGQSLDPSTQALFKAQFEQDFAHVRVHTDPRAAASARQVHALAYTVGSDIAFAEGRYQPASVTGRRLLAHELTHVLQQRSGPASPASTDRHEKEADAASEAIERPPGRPFHVNESSAVGIARRPDGVTADFPAQAVAAQDLAEPAVTPEIKARLLTELERVRLSESFVRTNKRTGAVTERTALEGTIGQHKNRTVAVAAIIAADGTVSFISAHFDEGHTEHAEPQLLTKIEGQVSAGSTVVIAIDQVPCGPGDKNCELALKQFRDDPNHGSLRVFTVRALRKDAPPNATPGTAAPHELVSPKTAVPRDRASRFLMEDKEFTRVRVPLYKGPSNPSTVPSGTSKPPSPPAAPAPVKPKGPSTAPKSESPSEPIGATPASQPAKVQTPRGGPVVIPPSGRGMARGAALSVAFIAVNNVLNAISDHVQRADAEKAWDSRIPSVEKTLTDQPWLGALVTFTWIRPDAPWFSLVQPGARFDGIETTFAETQAAARTQFGRTGHLLNAGPDDHIEPRHQWIDPLSPGSKPLPPPRPTASPETTPKTAAQLDQEIDGGIRRNDWPGVALSLNGFSLDDITVRVTSDSRLKGHLRAIMEGALSTMILWLPPNRVADEVSKADPSAAKLGRSDYVNWALSTHSKEAAIALNGFSDDQDIRVNLPRDIDKLRVLRAGAVTTGLDRITRLVDEWRAAGHNWIE